MRTRLGALALGVGFLLMVGTTATQAQQQSITVNMTAQNNSGITGTATLTDLGGGKTRVEIKANGAGAGPQPSHIHDGSCATLNPAPHYSLSPLVNGASTTEVSASLQQIQSVQGAIHLHKSQEEIPVYVACGDLPLVASASGSLPRAGGEWLSPGLVSGLATGAGLVLAGFALRRRRGA